MNECDVIANLWIELNPHCQVHGCQIDPEGSVLIYILFYRDLKWHPMELNIGSPAKAVIRQLKTSVRAQARTRRLQMAKRDTQSRRATGNSEQGELDGTDK